MRERLLSSMLVVAVTVALALGIPLIVVGTRLIRQNAQQQLENQAESLVRAVEREYRDGQLLLPNLERSVPAGLHVEVLDQAGHLVAPIGPEIEGSRLVAVDTGLLGTTVRVTKSTKDSDGQVHRFWGVVAAMMVGVLALATAMTRALSRRVGAPLADLAESSARLGAGDFSHRTPRSGIAELDALGETIDRSAARIGELVARERQFSTNASHQLRTSLTALRLRIEELTLLDDTEQMRAEARVALAQADRLELTIEDLLALSRQGRAGDVTDLDLAALVGEHASRWREALRRQQRELIVQAPDEPVIARATAGAIGQAMEIVVDNATRYGRGAVTIEVRSTNASAVIVISDEGSGIPTDAQERIFERGVSLRGGSGVGLALARDLVESDGGRIVCRRPAPPQFEIFLPQKGSEPRADSDVPFSSEAPAAVDATSPVDAPATFTER